MGWPLSKRTFYLPSKAKQVTCVPFSENIWSQGTSLSPVKTWAAYSPYNTMLQLQLNLRSDTGSVRVHSVHIFHGSRPLCYISGKRREFLWSTTGRVSFTPKVNLSPRIPLDWIWVCLQLITSSDTRVDSPWGRKGEAWEAEQNNHLNPNWDWGQLSSLFLWPQPQGWRPRLPPHYFAVPLKVPPSFFFPCKHPVQCMNLWVGL